MIRTTTIQFRVTPQERAALVEIRRAYGLPTLSAAARAVIRQAAIDRALWEEKHEQNTVIEETS